MISPLAFCVHLASVVNTIYVHFAVLLRAATLPTVSPTLEAKARLSVENLSCSKVIAQPSQTILLQTQNLSLTLCECACRRDFDDSCRSTGHNGQPESVLRLHGRRRHIHRAR